MPEDPNQGTRNTEEEDEQTPENAAYQGTAGTDIIVGSEEDDSVSSNAGVDIIMGGSGDDTLRGQGDADIIRGGSGADTIEGGEGADTFVFGPGHGSDTITDFDTDEDTIHLSAFGADLSYSDLTITATTDGTGTIITVPGEDGENNGITITLEGVTSTDVTESMFEFSNAGDDTVTDFSTTDDKIDLTAFGRDVSFDDLTIAATTDGTGTVITLPGEDGDTITLQGVTSTDVTADIFEFLAVDDTLTGTTADEIITGAYGDDTMTGGGGAATPSCSHPATATTRSPISARLTTRST